MEEPGRPLRQWLGTLMAFEKPKQQDQEEHDCQHEKTEVVAFSIRAAQWNTRCHTQLDAIFGTDLRVLIKLRETLRLYFSESWRQHAGPRKAGCSVCLPFVILPSWTQPALQT